MRTKNLLLVFITLLTATSVKIFAQASPLEAESQSPVDYFGFTIGLNANSQSGTAFPDCEVCSYEGGKGSSLYIGALYERVLSKIVNVGIDGGLNFLSIDPKYRKIENDTVWVGDRYDLANIEYRYQGTIKQTSLELAPYVKVKPLGPLFAKVGFAFDMPISTTFKSEKEILTNSVKLRNGETVTSIYFPDTHTKSKTLQDHEIDNLVAMQMYLNIGAGFEFQLRKGWFGSIYWQYNLPLTNVSDKGDGFKISSHRFNLSTRFAL